MNVILVLILNKAVVYLSTGNCVMITMLVCLIDHIFQKEINNSIKFHASMIVSIILFYLVVTFQGYYKVLGKGILPKQPVIVKAKFFSRIAEQKIKKVGGACVLVA